MKTRNLPPLLLSGFVLLLALYFWHDARQTLDRAEAVADATQVILSAPDVPAAPFYWDPEVRVHDHRIFRADVLRAVLEQTHGEEFAEMLCDLLRTHPDRDETFFPLWDEDILELGLDPIG